MKYASKILLLLLATLVQAACSNQAVYTGESFSSDSPFRMRAEGEVSMACESARRALLGQGYLIESAGPENVKGRKAYKTEDTHNTFIEMNIVCLGELSGSTLYATGVLTSYALKKSTSSASVGLSALGSISLPIGQSADSLVKVSEETIDDKDFYKRFFSAVDIILVEMRATRESAAPVVPVAIEPGPAPELIAPPAAAPVPASVTAAPVVVQEPAPDSVSPIAPVLTPAPVPPATTAGPEQTPPVPVTAPLPIVAPAEPAAVAETPPSPAAPQDVLAPFPVRGTHTPQPETVPDTPAVVPEPQAVQAPPVVATEPDPAARPTTVLEEFAAPRSEPFR